MADSDSFFRPGIFEAKRDKWTGRVVLSRPFSFVFLTCCTAARAFILVIFAFFGSYMRKIAVEGQLLPVSGLVRVYAPDTGVVASRKVADGNYVQQGDELLAISIPRYSGGGDVWAKLAKKAEMKRNMLLQEIERQKKAQQGGGRTLTGTVAKLGNQLADIRSQIQGQEKQVRLARQTIEKYQPLLRQGSIFEQQVIGYENEHLDQVSQLNALKREQVGVLRGLNTQKQTLGSLPARQETELSQLNRTVSEIKQEELNLDLQQEQTVHAGKSGYVSTSNVEVGQQVSLSRLLLSIISGSTELVANLYVPSRAADFISPNNKMVLCYQACPYQKFGHAQGEIISIAETALGKQELASLGGASADSENQVVQTRANEPVYLVEVKLKKQTIRVYGKNRPLQIGMVMEADILHEHKKLYKWVLDPLYSITGKLEQ